MPPTRRILAFGLIAVVIGGSYLWSLSRVGPAWYRPPAGNDPAMKELAERTEYRLIEEFQKIRPVSGAGRPDSEVGLWTIRLREEQMNAWLASRLPEWIQHEHDVQWPADLEAPQVRIRPRGIEIAVGVHHVSMGRRVVVVDLHPVVEGEFLRLDIRGLSVGKVAVPGHPVERLLQMTAEYSGIASDPVWADPATAAWLDVLTGKRPIDRRIALSDGRRIEVREFRLEEGSILLRARTLQAGAGE